MTSITRLPAETIRQIAAFATTSLSDALDRHDVLGAVEGLRPLKPGQKIAGQAVTLLYLPVGVTGGTAGDYLHLCEPGDIIAIDNRGRTDCTVWGGILSEAAKRYGIAGTVIDGATRDAAVTMELDYPMWACTPHMLTGKDRVMLQGVNVPITLGHVRVEPGDVIVADHDGVVVIPLSLVDDVIRAAAHIETVEGRIVADVRSGMGLAEARTRHSYFGLQRSELSAEADGGAS